MSTYIVYFRNGGRCKITSETFFRSLSERHVRFVVGNQNIAIFEIDAIIGFCKQEEGEENG